ncbi:S8 family serine peptidase [Bacillus sp. E(2018)]|uniref:S8 family serine peptidase n=1 Tax=Bacillus sp. E(2018) TaxID=2502239 RepID=UPI0010F58078|nr:S8 family serine peptidase [Bacillus sp. E(2018)]
MLNFTSKLGVFFISTSLLTASLTSNPTFAAESPLNQQNAPNSLTHSYIVGFHSQPNEDLIKQHNGTIHSRLNSIHALSVSLTVDTAQQLAQHPAVKFIEEDKQIVMEEQQVDPKIYELNYPTPQELQSESYFTGKNIKVGILDTGIDTTHEDLTVSGGISFVPKMTSYNDDNGHGTHVAGIIAAKDNQVGIKGLAPNVKLYSIKVLDQDGLGQYSQIIDGIEWATQQGLDIANLSLTGKESSYALKLAVDEAYKKGLYIIAASGNHSDSTFSEDQSVYYPAKYESVIAVGAVNKLNKHPKFSGSGPELELVAPGVDIYSTYTNNTYETLTGTSMATPYVTAIYALYKEAFPLLTTIELRTKIQQRAKDLGAPGRDVNFGFGLIQAPELRDTTPPTPPENVTYKLLTDGKINLSWTASQDQSRILGYNVYKNGVKIKNLLYGFQLTELIKPGSYQYEVSAVDEAGNESKKSRIQVTKLFSDVSPAKWYSEYIYDLNAKDITSGYPDGKYYPEKSIPRAEAITMIGRALKLDGKQRPTPFSDVPEKNFASGYITVMTQQKLVTGYPDGSFKPSNTITRGEVVTLLHRAFLLKNQSSQTKNFKDVTSDLYSYEAIQRFASESIATGYEDGTFKPNKPVTRSEMAVFLSKTLKESN